MPYIPPKERPKYADVIDELVHILSSQPETKMHGELNYVVFSTIVDLLEIKGFSYYNIQNMDGFIDCLKTEFKRRILFPYENNRIEENGDVISNPED